MLLWVVVEKNAIRRAFHVLVLTAPQRPEENRQPATAEDETRPQQIQDDVHANLRRRKLLAITSSDELDIAAAASQGVTKPATASGTISTL